MNTTLSSELWYLVKMGFSFVGSVVAAGLIGAFGATLIAWGLDDDYAKDHNMHRPGYIEWVLDGLKLSDK